MVLQYFSIYPTYHFDYKNNYLLYKAILFLDSYYHY